RGRLRRVAAGRGLGRGDPRGGRGHCCRGTHRARLAAAGAGGGAMTELTMWQQVAVMAALGLGSWVLRAGFIVVPAGRSAAAILERWLVYARPAILAALVASVLIRTADAETSAIATTVEAW